MYITYNHCHNSSVLFTGEYHVHSHQSVPYSLVAYAQECVLNTSEYRASCYNIQHIVQCVLNTSEYRASCYNIQHIVQCVLNTSEYRASCYNIQHIAQCVLNTSEYRASCYNIQHIAQCVLNTSEYRASCYNITTHSTVCIHWHVSHRHTNHSQFHPTPAPSGALLVPNAV